MQLRKYTLEQLQKAVKTSFSYRQVLQKLNVVPAGGNYEVLKKAIKHFNLDASHFRGMGWNKGMKLEPRHPIKYYFDCKQRLNTYRFKKRLISEGIFRPICSMCGLDTWLGHKMPSYRGKNMLKD